MGGSAAVGEGRFSLWHRLGGAALTKWGRRWCGKVERKHSDIYKRRQQSMMLRWRYLTLF